MKKLFYILILKIFLIQPYICAQIGINNPNPDANAALDIKANGNAMGVKFPSVTSAERNSMITSLNASGTNNLIVWDTDYSAYFYWNGTKWLELDEYNNTLRDYGFDPTTMAKEYLVSQGLVMKDVDGNYYKTKMFGNKRWTTEDLKTKTGFTTNTITQLQYCASSPNNWIYYNVDTVVKYTITPTTSLCPIGWHIPTRTEWSALFNSICPGCTGVQQAEKAMKKGTKLYQSYCSNCSVTNSFSPSTLTILNDGSSGLNLLPNAMPYTGDIYTVFYLFTAGLYMAKDVNGDIFFVSIPANETNKSWGFILYYLKSTDQYYGGGYENFSIRCIKD